MTKQLIILLLLLSTSVSAGITAEDILGEYWKDPLFGEAAESQTVNVEILTGRIWPEKIQVKRDQNIRFVFLNKSTENHMFVFSNSFESLLAKESFQLFIKDEIHHAKQVQVDPRSHSHSSSSIDEAEAIVKRLDQNPSVFVKPDEFKEILIRFSELGIIEFRCVISDHKEMYLKGIVEVVENE